MTLRSDKRQRALGSMDQSKKTGFTIYQDAPLGGGPRSFSDSAVFFSELVSRLSQSCLSHSSQCIPPQAQRLVYSQTPVQNQKPK